MAIYGALHPKSDVSRLYIKRKEGGKGLMSVEHLVSGCEKLAQKECKRRHDNVAKKVNWDLCKKNRLEHREKWYEHVLEGAVENEEVKML